MVLKPSDSSNCPHSNVDFQNETINLSINRVQSSIPKTGIDNNSCPRENSNCKTNNEQEATDNKNTYWIYPSPKMFYSAMKRKGTLPGHLENNSQLNEETITKEMDIIVDIHNIVNEQCWSEICKWENDQDISLKRFLGRPEDLSPKAWFKTNLMGYSRPFDRHDWYVTRKNGQIQRYIIDFYSGNQNTVNDKISFHLDVRPALDSFESLKLRLKRNFKPFL